MGSFSRQALGKQYDGFSDELMAQLFPNGLEDDPSEATAPKERVIMGQPHALAYINPEEERMLMEEGGQGTMTKEGIPAYWTLTEPSTWGNGKGYEGFGNFNASDNKGIGRQDGPLSDNFGTEASQYAGGLTQGQKDFLDGTDDYRPNSDGEDGYNLTTGSSGTSSAATSAADAVDNKTREEVLTGLTEEYNAYNESVNSFNNLFDEKETAFGETGIINNATIADIYDDPTTEENENLYEKYYTQFGDAAGALNDISLPEVPSLTSGDYTFEEDELPTLAEAKDYAELADRFSGLQQTLSGLKSERGTEEKRVGDFAGNLQSGLNNIGYDISLLKDFGGDYDLGMANTTGEINRILFGLNQDRSGFSSPIIGQMDNPFGTYDSSYGTSTGALSNFNTALGTEQTRIDNYDQGLFNYVDELLGQDSFGGYDISSGSALDTLKNEIDDRQRQAGRFSSDLNFDFGGSLSELQGLENQLDALIGERDVEQKRIDDFRTTVGDIGFGYSQDANALEMTDIDKINTLNRNIASVKAEIDRFNSPLSYNFDDITGEGGFLAGAETRLSDLLTERGLEQTRIDDEGTRINDLYDQYSSLFSGSAEDGSSGLNITNINQLNKLRKDIDDAQLAASRFDSDLSTDSAFRYPLEDLSSLEGNIDQMLIDRQDELDRIETAQTDVRNAASAIESTAEAGNYYSKAALDAIQELITTGQRDISEFDSLLDYNFGEAGLDGTAVQNYMDSQVLLDDLIDKRASNIDEIASGITGSIADLEGTEPYNEDALKEMLRGLNESGNELAYYSGGRVGDLTKDISKNKGLINTRLDDLYGQRDQYEADALQMLTELGDTDYSRENYEQYVDLIDPLRANIDLYGASQAADEMRAIDNELARRLGLVEADELAVQQRQTDEGQGYGFTNEYALTDPINVQSSGANYYNLFDEEEEELDEFGNPISAFSANVRAA